MNIVILDTNTLTRGDLDFSPIDALGDTKYYDILPPADIVPFCADADAVLINKAGFTKEVISSLPRLKYIGLFATGYNNVDLEAASAHGVAVANVPGYSTVSVSQLVFSFILMHASSLPMYNELTHNGEWRRSGSFSWFPYPITELSGKTLGIIGFGNIGRKVAEIGNAFGMRILFSNRRQITDTPFTQTDHETIFREADYITLHCPLNPDSEGLVNRDTLKLMKKSAFLINTSRGGVVDSAALAEALNEEWIAGAGIDVLPTEPIAADEPLLNAGNCIITPHIGWAALESRKRCVEIVAANLKAWMDGAPVNIVNEWTNAINRS